MERYLRTIEAFHEDGSSVFIDEYQEFIETNSFGSGREMIPGMKRLELRGGRGVNMIDESTFEIVATGQRVSTKSPK